MAKQHVIPNTHTNLILVERIEVLIDHSSELQTQILPIVGWFVDTEDYERYSLFIGSPIVPDDIGIHWGILNTTTGIVINQYDVQYENLEYFEAEMDRKINENKSKGF